MTISERGLALIEHFEGGRLRAYKCPAGVWTIGYGHTGHDVREGLEISQAQAGELLAADCRRFEQAVSRLVAVPLSQNRFDALVSLAFNIGEGNLQRSTLLKMVNDDPGDPAIRQEFLRWDKAGGAIMPGLRRRREAEAGLYFA